MKGLGIVVCSTVHVPFILIPEGYSKIPVDLGVVDIIEEIIQHSIPSDESLGLAFVA